MCVCVYASVRVVNCVYLSCKERGSSRTDSEIKQCRIRLAGGKRTVAL